MKTYPWRRAVSLARNYIDSQTQETRRNVIARADEVVEKPTFSPGQLTPEDRTSIALGVTFAVLILAAVAIACWYFFVRQRKQPTDEEKGDNKRNWWMVDKKDEKGGLSEWWRKSYAVPDRVEPPPSAGPRSSLQRLRSALARKAGSKKGDEESIPSPPATKKLTSPTMTIDLPMQTVPQAKPRYPSVLERGYRVPLYPTAVQAQDNTSSRSLTSPAPQRPLLSVAERSISTRRKVSVPPRALKISNGRPLVSFAERRLGVPRSPAHRRKGAGLVVGQFKHPFIPLKDSDTDFPTISAPFPSAETGETNPKLSYNAPNTSYPRVNGPRVSRASSRRVPVPISISSAPIRPLMPATPLHLREETRILPPGQSPSVPRPAPTPL